MRNGKEHLINSEQLVKGDIIILSEGDKVPADAKVIKTTGIGVNESLLTGEPVTVYKSLKDNGKHFKSNYCYKGTDIVNGSAILCIEEVGINTVYGKIGVGLNDITNEDSSLQRQVSKVVKIYAIVSFALFICVMITTFLNSGGDLYNRITGSLISGITIAIATIPEEIPVILTIFLAMGASTLSKHNTLTRNMKSVENLGKITVLCTDKTGTITENKMKIKEVFADSEDFYKALYLCTNKNYTDSMEKAMRSFSQKKTDDYNAEFVRKYLFNSDSKMTGMLYKEKSYNLYVKGAFENVIKLCNVSAKKLKELEDVVNKYALDGLRVIAVAFGNSKKIKENITDYKLKFMGIVALEDPIRRGIKEWGLVIILTLIVTIPFDIFKRSRWVMNLDDLKKEYDKLQKTYGDENLNSIYFGGCETYPNICFVFINPTGRNIASSKDWQGIRAPWIGTKNIWDLFYNLNLLDENIYHEIKNKKSADWTKDFANKVYDNVKKHKYYITNLGKCTQIDARPLANKVYLNYLDLLLKEIEIVNPKVIILFGNQVSSIVLKEKISVSLCRKEKFNLKTNNKTYDAYSVYYPVGNGRFNIDKSIEDIKYIMDTYNL